MAGTEAPQMQVLEPVAVALDGRPYPFRHAAVGIYIEQDGAGIANEPV